MKHRTICTYCHESKPAGRYDTSKYCSDICHIASLESQLASRPGIPRAAVEGVRDAMNKALKTAHPGDPGWREACKNYLSQLTALLATPAATPAATEDESMDTYCHECRLDPCGCVDKTTIELVSEAFGHITFFFDNKNATGAESTNELRYAQDKLRNILIEDVKPAATCGECARLRAALEIVLSHIPDDATHTFPKGDVNSKPGHRWEYVSNMVKQALKEATDAK